MNKNKLLRVMMLLSLLAPTAGSVTVLAQDALPEVNQTTATSTDDVTSTDSDSQKEKDPNVTTEDQANPVSSDDISAKSDVLNPAEPTRPEPEDQTDQSTTPNDTIPGQDQGHDKTPSSQEPSKTPQESPVPVSPAPQVPATVTPLPWSPFASDLNLEIPVLPSVNTYAAYVEHWSGKDAYTHNLLSRRYGIKAEQIDGYLKSTGISYDKTRINGEKLLQWEKKSGLDVRAIVAIAMSESSLGTKGVATLLGANMFGYAAFDIDPTQASKFNDDVAIIKMTQETIIKNKNTNFALQDAKAAKFSLGQLNFATDGGVYFTDITGSGKRRAQIMEDMDEWIDAHGGTPAIPAELKIQSSSSFAEVPTGYKLSKSYDVLSYQASSYAWGQCTWYVYNRAKELGYQFDPFMGNGGDWKYKAGYALSKTPKVGYAVSFAPGQAGADGMYGHVSIVEDVRKDGSILISESNCIGLGKVSYRTFTAQQADQLTYVVGKK
ncbi:CHAP domain-containing protein [Streptococcus dysgalactiae subsp. dysgalactiae]|uniref:CHAP domain-containing protein n=1 Tax=Streptococcus dysgalactiae TaxID=1334 RepID=UPI001CF0D7C5|nr:CHAP domain-containing protein [Streptococcus dysgalactiae]MCB2846506.1 CHAP domain-containing protein [Streptococcus dysgalactiae subsp. dysgalactiae]